MSIQTTQEHVTEINKLRLANKNSWYQYNAEFFQLKAFGNWVQVFQCNKFKDSSPHDMTVKQFKDWLASAIEAS